MKNKFQNILLSEDELLELKGFIEQLEQLSLPSALFDHKGHLKAAFAFNLFNEKELAIRKCCHAISRYAEHLGAKEKFHHTITASLMVLVRQRMTEPAILNFEDLLQKNSGLVDDAYHELLQYYDEEVLKSAVARQYFVPPNKNPHPEVT